MKKETFRVLGGIIFINMILISLFFIPNSYGATEEINSRFGETPVIDGEIDLSIKEWSKAVKIATTIGDLDIDLWVMQDYSNLYISVQIDLEPGYHNATEFVGIIISNSSSEDKDEFIDAKIVQFSNILENTFSFLDFYINDSIFLNDTVNNGNGAGKLEGLVSTYEFSFPIDNLNGDEEDVELNFESSYAFNISYGDNPIYPSGIKKSGIFLINIKALSTSPPSILNLALTIVCVIIFSILGAFLGFYLYKIIRLKAKIEKFKR